MESGKSLSIIIKLKIFAHFKNSSKNSNGDVDMRFLPNVSAATTTVTSVTTAECPEKDNTTSSNSNSSSGVVMVDYSQYLKDSNLSFDKGDICKF